MKLRHDMACSNESLHYGLSSCRSLAVQALAALPLACRLPCTGRRIMRRAPSGPAAPTTRNRRSTSRTPTGWKVASPQDAMLRGKWWEIFNEPELNALEEQLNINNQNIKQFFENFMEARAAGREARAQYWPTITTGPPGAAPSLRNLRQNSTGQHRIHQPLSGPFLWTSHGRPTSGARFATRFATAQYGAQVSAADLENESSPSRPAWPSTTSRFAARTCLQKIPQRHCRSRSEGARLTQGALRRRHRRLHLRRRSPQHPAKRRISASMWRFARAQYEHAIAMLLGKLATDFSIPVKPLFDRACPPFPPASVATAGAPPRCCRRRAHPGRSERHHRHRLRRILSPRSLSPPPADSRLHLRTLVRLAQPLLVHRPIGLADHLQWRPLSRPASSVHSHLQRRRRHLPPDVLTAFQQVEDYLAATRIFRSKIKQREAVDSAQTTLNLEMGRYETGIDPYIDVTVAQITLLSDQQPLVTLQMQETVAWIELIQALGGGWDLSQLPTPAQLSKKSA